MQVDMTNNHYVLFYFYVECNRDPLKSNYISLYHNLTQIQSNLMQL